MTAERTIAVIGPGAFQLREMLLAHPGYGHNSATLLPESPQAQIIFSELPAGQTEPCAVSPDSVRLGMSYLPAEHRALQSLHALANDANFTVLGGPGMRFEFAEYTITPETPRKRRIKDKRTRAQRRSR